MHAGIIDILVAALFGGLIGLLSGLVGIGGGVLIVPMLLFYYGLDIHTAVSTSILAITLIIASFFAYYAKLRVLSIFYKMSKNAILKNDLKMYTSGLFLIFMMLSVVRMLVVGIVLSLLLRIGLVFGRRGCFSL